MNMFQCGRTFFVLAALSALAPVNSLMAKVNFINLRGQNVYVAQARYTYEQGGVSNTISNEQWRYSGWWRIAPGETLQLSAGYYHVANAAGGGLSWRGLESRSGLIRWGSFPEIGVPVNDSKREADLIRQGYRRAQYQYYKNNSAYRISGSAYRLEQKPFPVDCRSRSIQRHFRTFDVNGRIAYFDHNIRHKGASLVDWRQEGSRLSLSVVTRGSKGYIGAARSQGYYTGTVTVFYTAKN